jgi:hypothetical protein
MIHRNSFSVNNVNEGFGKESNQKVDYDNNENNRTQKWCTLTYEGKENILSSSLNTRS